MSDSEWHAYIAGFFDGEGSVSIVRNRANGRSDYHKVIVTIGQRAKHRAVLDRIAAEFGGAVGTHTQLNRLNKAWAEQAHWQLQDKQGMRRFFEAMQPYVIVKAKPIEIGLRFLETFQSSPNLRDDLGRIRGRGLSVAEIERRERLRLEMREANALGPPRGIPSALPPFDLRHRLPATKLVGDVTTIRRGDGRTDAKLTADIVQLMRAEYAVGIVTHQELAARYGVSRGAISKVLHRKTWAHVV